MIFLRKLMTLLKATERIVRYSARFGAKFFILVWISFLTIEYQIYNQVHPFYLNFFATCSVLWTLSDIIRIINNMLIEALYWKAMTIEREQSESGPYWSKEESHCVVKGDITNPKEDDYTDEKCDGELYWDEGMEGWVCPKCEYYDGVK